MLNFFLCVGSAIGVGLWVYLKKFQEGQSWEWGKFLQIVAVGIVVGVVAKIRGLTPVQITPEYLAAASASYAGFVFVLLKGLQIFWNVVKFIINRIKKREK